MPITDQFMYLGSTVRVDCGAEKYIKQRKCMIVTIYGMSGNLVSIQHNVISNSKCTVDVL